jgi:hypothetical protein
VLAAAFGVIGVLVTLAWLEFLAWRERRAQRRRDCENRGHQFETPQLHNFAINPDYTGYTRRCRHCGVQQHEKREGGWK